MKRNNQMEVPVDVNKVAVRLSLLQAVQAGIKKHFKSARFLDQMPELGLLRVRVLGCTFDVHIVDIKEEPEPEGT